jgi:carboxylate-amine ligase
MYINFNAASHTTIGLELEIQTINKSSCELVPGAGLILSQLPGEVLFKPELFNSTIEINTPVCESMSEIESHLEQNLQKIRKIAHQHQLDILISGCHPFSDWREQQITQQKRYLNLLHRIQWPVRQFLIFGLHVHIGIDNADKSIYVMNRLTNYIPHLIALSASSPFWNGFDTGLATSRIKIFEELPNAGIPYYFKNWNMYSNLVETLITSNSIDTVRDLWWDIRPHPIFGTIEVRVCDAMPTLKENLAITSLIYLLVSKFGEEYNTNGKNPRLERWILAENKWRASRYGIQGEIIKNKKGQTEKLKDALYQLYEELLQFSNNSRFKEAQTYLAVIPEILKRGPSYSRQREWSRECPGDYRCIAERLIKEAELNDFL